MAVIFFPSLFPLWPTPIFPITPGEVFSPQHIVRKARDQVESAAAKKIAPLAEAADDCKEAYKEVKEARESAQTLGKVWEKLSAEEKYESIRNSKTDVAAIAKNTGYNSKNIQDCKNHIFYNTHRLDRYESLGEPVEIKRFDANDEQARAWKRLEEGTHTQEDLTWLKHEKAEQWYEQRHNAGYSESHEKAESKWSGSPWTNTEDK